MQLNCVCSISKIVSGDLNVFCYATVKDSHILVLTPGPFRIHEAPKEGRGDMLQSTVVGNTGDRDSPSRAQGTNPKIRYGVHGNEPQVVLYNNAGSLTMKSGKSCSETSNFMMSTMSIAIVQGKSHCMYAYLGSRIPTYESIEPR